MFTHVMIRLLEELIQVFHILSVVNIGTALENLENTATVDSDIMSKISASNEDLLQTKSNLTLQLSELTAQIKMDIKMIQ